MTPLDQYIITVAALAENPHTPLPLHEVLAIAAASWRTMSPEVQERHRRLHRPAFNVVAAAVLNDAAKEIAATDDGSVIDTYRTEFSAHLAARAKSHQE